MSTNDTLRGLLRECLNNLGPYPDLGDRIRAALAEPVSGGVAIDQRAYELTCAVHRALGLNDSYLNVRGADSGYVNLFKYNDVQAAYEVIRAALNGGAVAGQCATCRGSGVVSTTDKDHNGDHIEQRCPICDCRQGRDACTCKGGE